MKLKITPAYVRAIITNSQLFKYFLFKALKLLFKKNGKDEIGNSILILSFHKLGDTILTFGTVKAILENYKNRKIFVACLEPNGKLYKYFFPQIDFVEIKKEDFKFGKYLNDTSLQKIKNIKPETIIDLTGSYLTMRILFEVDSKERIGINDNSYSSLYTTHINYRTSPPLREMYFDVARKMKIAGNPIFIASNELTEKKYDILIHPFAGWSAKEWNLKNFRMLFDKLQNRFTLKIISDEYNANRLHRYFSNNEIMISNSPEELIKMLKQTKLFICNDSGPMHLAAILRVATFTIYGGTNPIYHLPEGDNHSFIQKKISCTPTDKKYCYTHGGYFCKDVECLNTLSVDEVYNSLCEFINNKKIFEQKYERK